MDVAPSRVCVPQPRLRRRHTSDTPGVHILHEPTGVTHMGLHCWSTSE